MNQTITILENNKKAVYTYMEKGDSQGYHIRYTGPRGTYVTTHLGFFSVVKDCLKRGFKIIDSTFNNIDETISEAKKVIQHEQEVHERWMKTYGSRQILI